MDVDTIERLVRLRDLGALSDEEFQREKTRILDQDVAEKRQEKPRSGMPIGLALFAAIAVIVVPLTIVFNRGQTSGEAQSQGATTEAGSYPLDENMLINADDATKAASQQSPTVKGIPPKLISYVISREGLGPIKFGMNLSEVRRASGLDIQNLGFGDSSEPSSDGYTCWGMESQGFPILMLAQNDKLSVINVSTTFDEARDVIVTYPEFQTDRGIRLLDSIEKVKSAYSPIEAEESHGGLNHYYWYAKDEVGLQFGISNIAVGSGEIKWFSSEGCSGA